MGSSELSPADVAPSADRSGRAAAAYAAARLYFEDGLSQAAIADHLSVSRSTVSRLIAEAQELGIVRIEIRPPIAPARLGDELCSALGLHRVVVTSAESQPLLMAAAVDELGRVGLRADDVLLLGWGRTMSAIATARLPSLSGVRIVPAVGGMDERERPFHSNEIVRHAAEHSGATPHLLHAPAAPTPALRQALLADDAVDAVVGLWDRLDAALVGIGVPPGKPGSFTPGHVLTNGARDALSRAAGDIVTRYFDLAGAPVAYPAEQRLLAVSREQLRQARTRIGVAAGQDKHRAIVGAARAGLIDVLVTDGPTAAAALELAGATA